MGLTHLSSYWIHFQKLFAAHKSQTVSERQINAEFRAGVICLLIPDRKKLPASKTHSLAGRLTRRKPNSQVGGYGNVVISNNETCREADWIQQAIVSERSSGFLFLGENERIDAVDLDSLTRIYEQTVKNLLV